MLCAVGAQLPASSILCKSSLDTCVQAQKKCVTNAGFLSVLKGLA